MVYYCSVKGCKNNSKMKKKDPNIVLSFHAFPTKEASKQKWLRAIGRPSWKPPSFARLCSAHFDLDHISHEGCRIRMMDDACPVNGLPPNSNFEASNVEVCRICLATDLKMFSLQGGLLSSCLQSFASLKEIWSIEGLPEFVCYECSARLSNCYSLIDQSTIAQAVLLDLFTKNGQVTKKLVKQQDRKALGLESSLQCYTADIHDYTLNEGNTIKNDPNIMNKTSSNMCDMEISKQDSINEELYRKLTHNHLVSEGKMIEKIQRIVYNEKTVQGAVKPKKYLLNSNDIKMTSHDYTNIFDEDAKERKTLKSENMVNSSKYQCVECNINFASEGVRNVHLLTSKQHRKKPDTCDPCAPDPATKNLCSNCGIQCSTTKELIAHIRSDHPRPKRCLRRNEGYPVKCEHCEEIVNTRWQHWLHVRRQHPDKKHTYRAQHNSVCQRCGKQFQNSTKLRHHELRHGPAALPCTHCGRAFHDTYALRRHARTHARAELACELCSRAFRTKHNLIRHQRVHTGETPYGCNVCSKRFKHSTSLQLHIRSAHCNIPAPKRNKITVEPDSNKL